MPEKHFRCLVAPVYKTPDILCPCQDRAIAVGIAVAVSMRLRQLS
ncbi:hypothetical protein [Nostoc sp. JL33]|nr:hypothetical protein [Nostoc sp. JL33]